MSQLSGFAAKEQEMSVPGKLLTLPSSTKVRASMTDSKRQSLNKRASVSSGEGVWLVQSRQRERDRELGSSSHHSLRWLFSPQSPPDIKNERVKDKTEEAKEETTAQNYSIQEGGKTLLPSSSVEHGAIEISFLDGSAASSKNNDNWKRKTTAPSNLPSLQSVSFSSCTVRYYPTILGDNPFVSSGPSLSLGWDYDPSATNRDIPLDAYESSRSNYRRSGWDLVLSRAERERRLLDRGISRDAIASGVRDVMYVKNRMRRTVLNMQMSGAEELIEGLSRSLARGVRIRRSSRFMYDEWMKSGGTAAAAPQPLHLLPGHDDKHAGAKTSLVADSTQKEEPEKREVIRERRTNAQPPAGPAFGISRRSISLRGKLLIDATGNKEGDKSSHRDEGRIADGDQTATKPFAYIDQVFPASPAAEAGLQNRDQIIKFGRVHRKNHRKLRAVIDAGVAAAARDQPILLLVLRENSSGNHNSKESHPMATIELTIKPRKWNGAGLFGFLLKQCQPALSVN